MHVVCFVYLIDVNKLLVVVVSNIDIISCFCKSLGFYSHTLFKHIFYGRGCERFWLEEGGRCVVTNS
jgi:hypothetical protein